jgi:hypothetical protein
VEKKTVSGFDLLCFTTTQSSILVGGSEKVDFASKYVNFYTESNIAFQYGRVDTGDSLSFADCLKITYVNNELQPLDSEVPRPPSDRVTPFGFDRPQFTKDLCYPPYVINNPLLSDIAVEDTTLYSAPAGNYDVFWGDNTKAALGGNTLTLLQKLEFQSYDKTSVQTVSNVTLQTSFYTHKMKIELPIDTDVYDQDVTEFFGNGESVKDSFYLFVSLNG